MWGTMSLENGHPFIKDLLLSNYQLIHSKPLTGLLILCLWVNINPIAQCGWDLWLVCNSFCDKGHQWAVVDVNLIRVITIRSIRHWNHVKPWDCVACITVVRKWFSSCWLTNTEWPHGWACYLVKCPCAGQAHTMEIPFCHFMLY